MACSRESPCGTVAGTWSSSLPIKGAKHHSQSEDRGDMTITQLSRSSACFCSQYWTRQRRKHKESWECRNCLAKTIRMNKRFCQNLGGRGTDVVVITATSESWLEYFCSRYLQNNRLNSSFPCLLIHWRDVSFGVWPCNDWLREGPMDDCGYVELSGVLTRNACVNLHSDTEKRKGWSGVSGALQDGQPCGLARLCCCSSPY